jgi:hypothetical protein
VQVHGGTVLDGSAYEAESGRPYGPWIDAIKRLPASSVGNTIGVDLTPLVPEWPFGSGSRQSRESLFGAVFELISARAYSAAPFAHALASLCHYGMGNLSARSVLEKSIDRLRIIDAKHRLVFVLTSAAELEMRAGDVLSAWDRASWGLEIALNLERKSEVIHSLILLVEAAVALQRNTEAKHRLAELRALSPIGISKHARDAMERTHSRFADREGEEEHPWSM